MALIVCAAFKVRDGLLDELIQLAPAEWHARHEDVVTMLSDYRSPAAVAALPRPSGAAVMLLGIPLAPETATPG
jgi:hypothetical protein